MPLAEFSGTLDVKRAAHLLRRTTFGASKQEIDDFVGLTPAQAITKLYRTTLPDPEPPVNLSGTPWPELPRGDDDGDKQEFFKRWFVGQMLGAGITSDRLAYTAREKIVYFLHTHFTAIQSTINDSRGLYFQNQLFRLFALDDTVTDETVNFKTLTKKVSVDNAMLRLLDGYISVKGAPNENYARELMELYTIGRGLEVDDYFGEPATSTDSDTDYIVYRESDVQAAAKVLTGWERDEDYATLDEDTGLPRGKVRGSTTNASAHDNDEKVFSERLGNAAVTPDATLLNGGNPTEESALDEISQLIELIYAQEETAKNICRKIYRFFVFAAHNETDILAIDSAIITELVTVLETNNYKIQPVIETLLKSQHFYDGANASFDDDGFGALIKSPLDVVLQTINFFEITVPDMASDPTSFYDFMEAIINQIDDMGMSFYEPYDVAGYEAYHQFPMYHRNWITVNYLANRYDFIQKFLNPDRDSVLKIPTLVHLMTIIDGMFGSDAADARNLLEELLVYLFPMSDALTYDTSNDTLDDNSGLSAARMNYFLTSFLSDIDPDPEGAWTDRWTNKNGVDTLTQQLQLLFNAILQSPEFQLG